MPAPPPRSPRFVQLQAVADADTREEILRGLQAPAASIAPKFFYDALGSHLFAAITELEEYYPTRTEAAIMNAALPEIARALGAAPASLVDLGAGNCRKAARMFPVLAPARYVALDISVEFLRESLAALQREFPAIDMLGVGVDFTRRLALPDDVPRAGRLLFYPGSSIGNFAPQDAVRLLAQMRAALDATGALLIGADLVKDAATLEAAYDDALGVTAAFNRNVLRHIGRLAGTDFALAEWRHVARFDRDESRIEMHLEARRALTVHWTGGARRFTAGERIHTENSYKYTPESFERLLARAGLRLDRAWYDARQWFGVFLARPASG